MASAVTVLVAAAAASAWVLATEHQASVSAPFAPPRPDPKWPVTPAGARAVRDDALRRARVRVPEHAAPGWNLDVVEPPLTCRFVPEAPSGTSPKFDCALEDGEVVKVKYGRNPEIVAEVAATRLISGLGYPADRMTIASRVRCIGCPRFPFVAMHLLQLAGLERRYPYDPDAGYSDFEWVAIERKYPAAAIETPDLRGWAWWELKQVDTSVGASRSDLDALHLLAVFLAHWDNKSENQRLVCLDPPAGADRPCSQPLAMLQDLGATFGPSKANLAKWRHTPVWDDRASCTLSMEGMPWHGGTFPEVQIGEAGRSALARALASIDDATVRALFSAARFPEHYAGSDDDKDLAAWTAAFRHRVDQIIGAGPCPLD